MKAVILYRPNTELESSVNEYVREFARQTAKTIDLIDVDTVQGSETAKLYEIVQYPAILVFRNDGAFIESWTEREKWPTISELSFYNQ